MKNKNNEETDFYIPTYVINLKDRIDRRNNMMEQFQDKSEFDLNFIEAETHSLGTVGLWKSIVKVIHVAIENNDDVILLCEDDHTFTSAYNKEYLFANLVEASKIGAELLAGGIGGFGVAVPVASNLYWMDWFWCNQFVIIFRPLFERILAYSFTDTDTADGVLSVLTYKKMTMYPFISIQKDFGYSDVTLLNNKVKGLISSYFVNTNERFSLIHKINQYYNYKDLYQQYIPDRD